MPKKERVEGLQEERSRVTLFLPAHTAGHVRAIRAITQYLESQRTSKNCPVTGFTLSNYPDCGFRGTWWSAKRKKWILERVTLLILDYKQPLNGSLDNALGRLNQRILDSYKKFGSEQESIWMVAERVQRFK